MMRGAATLMLLTGLWAWSSLTALEIAQATGASLSRTFAEVQQALDQADAALQR